MVMRSGMRKPSETLRSVKGRPSYRPSRLVRGEPPNLRSWRFEGSLSTTMATLSILARNRRGTLAKVPRRFRARMLNVAMVVESEPSKRQLRKLGGSPRTSLLGLYEGRPLTERSVSDGFLMPDRITIFQGPHERLARDLDHLRE